MTENIIFSVFASVSQRSNLPDWAVVRLLLQKHVLSQAEGKPHKDGPYLTFSVNHELFLRPYSKSIIILTINHSANFVLCHNKCRINLINRRFILFTLKLFYLVSCASQVPPSGGPVDKTPPTIINAIPENKATLVPLDQQIEFEFSEAMTRKGSEKAVFISPDPGDRVRLKWKGRRLRIEFSDSLKINRTYVITLGTDLKDAHNNSLTASYTLAFSTGPELSDGKMSGRVFTDEKAKGILIWAYILEESKDPNPGQKGGDYITQTDAQGKFELTNLSEGLYRLFAIRDADNNRFYETGFDGIGVTSRDILLTKDSLAVSDIHFKVVTVDTIGPALVSISTQDNAHLMLTFDEELSPETLDDIDHYKVRVKDSKGEDTLAIRFAYLNELDQKVIMIITEPQTSRIEYEIGVQNITDLYGNLVDSKFNSAEFVGSALPDTFKPKIVSTTPADSAQAVFLNSMIAVYFNEPMHRESFERSFYLRDSTGLDVPGTFDWPTPASVKFKPANFLQSLVTYQAIVKLDSIFDLAGNAAADSTFQFHFTTLNADTLSSLSGTVVEPDSTANGRIFLKAQQNTKDGQTYEIQLNEPGPYEFSGILPGTYSIEGFRDRDNNGEYSFGLAFPFQPAERFAVYPDTIKVRSRWPNEGNDLVFKK